MAEQMGTPNSSADLSVNGGKNSAPKDKNCPFCHQAFTSSSLGRHLDLYIKEKNPKAADGIHSVDEIRKLRGGITRRQPRNSTSRREDSTPAGTPGGSERRSPNNDSDMTGSDSPSLRRDDGAALNMMCMSRGVPTQMGNRRTNFVVNGGTWESTGVMNHIPQARNGEPARSWDGDESRDGTRRLDGRNRSVSKQMLAKTTFEQKQKMMEALDNAKAAELALRELLGSFRAAKQRIEGPNIFDYDPFSLDFPALTLHCLPPPPTLYASTPIPNSSSWSILPPDELQYQALRKHFSSEFHRYRISISIATTAPQDDLSYPSQESFNLENLAALHQQAEADAQSMEARISEHLHSMFGHWNSLPPNTRTELWTLELARNIGRKSEEISKLKKEKELLQQETAHSKLQVEELSRLQQPREFRIQPPSPIPIDSGLMAEIGKNGTNYKAVGFQLMDRSLHIDTAVERAIGRWKGVVKQARGGSGQSGSAGMAAQKPLESNVNEGLPPSNAPQLNSTITSQPLQEDTQDIGSDQDADGDADMEEDDTFVDMTDVNAAVQRAPEAPMSNTTNFRLANGGINMQGVNAGGNSRGNVMEGIENQTHVQGYVRIGA